MKKSLYLLAALSLLGTNVFAKEVVATPATESSKEVIVEPVIIIEEAPVEAWKFAGRMYLETEDFDNSSKISRGSEGFFEMEDLGDGADGLFWGTGVSGTKGKLTLDLNVERRYFGDLSGVIGGSENDATRVDWKVRYQLFEKQAFHLKYRNEKADSSRRDRVELGTDWNHFDGLFAGWFVVGHDEDKAEGAFDSKGNYSPSDRTNGNYWEGDFGPSFKLTDSLSLNPTIYTTGEYYDGYEMIETQLRIMMPYQLNDKITIMPRVRITLDKSVDDKLNGSYVTNYEQKLGDRVRYELMANAVLTDNLSAFVGVAYDASKRDFKNSDKFGSGTDGKQDANMWWSYVGLNYNFN